MKCRKYCCCQIVDKIGSRSGSEFGAIPAGAEPDCDYQFFSSMLLRIDKHKDKRQSVLSQNVFFQPVCMYGDFPRIHRGDPLPPPSLEM